MRSIFTIVVLMAIVMAAGCSSSPQTEKPSDVVVPESWWGHYNLSVGQRLVVNSLNVSIEFKGAIVEGRDTLPANTIVLLTIHHNALIREVQVTANTKYSEVCGWSCSCTDIADDLPSWKICVSRFTSVKGVYSIRVNLNQSFRH